MSTESSEAPQEQQEAVDHESTEIESSVRQDSIPQRSVTPAPKEESDSESEVVDTDPEHPDLILGKFRNQEDLIKGYQSLQKKLSSVTQKASKAQSSEKSESKDEETQTENKEKQQESTLSSARETLELVREYKLPYGVGKYIDQYADVYGSKAKRAIADIIAHNGEVTPIAMEQLSKLGFNAEQVKSEIAKVDQEFAPVEKQLNWMINTMGGKDSVKEMVTWAQQNMPKAQFEKIKMGFNYGTVEEAMTNLTELNEEYQKVNGQQPQKHVQGVPSSTQTVQWDGTQESLDKLVADKRYMTDDGYTNAIRKYFPKGKTRR